MKSMKQIYVEERGKHKAKNTCTMWSSMGLHKIHKWRLPCLLHFCHLMH